MSYGAVGDGWLTLRMDEQAKSGLKETLLARCDELCQSEQEATPEFCESIHRCYEAKKQALEKNEPCAWLKREFSDVRFYDVSVDENAAQKTVYIEVSFDGKYYEEQIMGLLDTLSAWTVEGSFSFRGEDDALWRFHFTGAEWTEQNGEISYVAADAAEKREGPYAELNEADETYNDLNRRILDAFYKENGSAFLGTINLSTEKRQRIAAGTDHVLEKYTGQPVYNFGCDFVVPVADRTLEQLILDWNGIELSHGQLSIEKIIDTVERSGGHQFLWY